MAKLIRCPACGRMNTPGNAVCSNCGIIFETKKEFPSPKEEIKEQNIEKTVEKTLEKLPLSKIRQRFNWEFLRPNETNLFLFVSLVFTSLFLHLLVKSKIIFSIFFYPSLYAFSCHWASKPRIDVQNFLFQFIILLLLFFIVFAIL